MSSSDEGELQVDVSDPVDDPSAHCPVCRGSTFIGETIACEVCEMWYHFGCVDVTGTDDVVTKEDVPYFCPSCRDPSGDALKKVQRKEKKKRKKKQNPPPPKKAGSNVGVKKVAAAAPAVSSSPMKSPPIKLKINLSSALVSSSPASSGSESSPKASSTSSKSGKSLLKVAVTQSFMPLGTTLASTADETEDSKKRKRRTSADEEERWLDAVESGDMIIDPELRSIKDPERMTVRQRAMVERSRATANSSGGEEPTLEEEGHMALDYGYKKKEEENEHTMRIKAIKSQKRKEVELERREESKKKTMDRLLKKKDSKLTKQAKAMRPPRREIPQVTYRLTLDGATVSMPPGYEFPGERKGPIEPPKPAFCSVPGCCNPKKYSCSRSGRPVCSLKCYRQNLVSA